MEWYCVWWPWLASKRVVRVCQYQLRFLSVTALISPVDLDLSIYKLGHESPVSWASFLPIFSFLSPSVLLIRVRHGTDRRTDNGHQCIIPPFHGAGIINRSAWLRLACQRALMCFVTVTLTTLVERPSNRSRIVVVTTISRSAIVR